MPKKLSNPFLPRMEELQQWGKELFQKTRILFAVVVIEYCVFLFSFFFYNPLSSGLTN